MFSFLFILFFIVSYRSNTSVAVFATAVTRRKEKKKKRQNFSIFLNPFVRGLQVIRYSRHNPAPFGLVGGRGGWGGQEVFGVCVLLGRGRGM